MEPEKKKARMEPDEKKAKKVPEKKQARIWDEPCPFVNTDILNAFGEEVHLFMHVHLRGYDREGQGLHMDASFYDKYGAPVTKKDAWMEGYHAIEKQLAEHFNKCCDTNTDFPLVAGMAGGAHLYKPVKHDIEPWNWTGFVPQRKIWCTINKFHKNRHFLSLRGNEIQNNLWDYHPFQEQEGAEKFDETYEQISPLDSFEDKGYWLKGDPWARYIHLIALKSHDCKDFQSHGKAGDNNHLRYKFIVHPLAYRKSLNYLPDNSVDGVQWSNLNIKNDVHFNGDSPWGRDVQGLEIFNDFTYYYSTTNTKEDRMRGINVNNGTVMHIKENNASEGRPRKEYVYWYDTYPLEFGEFLLDTCLERGVYFQVLAANDAFYNEYVLPYDDHLDGITYEDRRSFLLSDPKGVLIEEHLLPEHQPPETYCTKAKWLKNNATNDYDFYARLPYTTHTVFGHTTLIDTEQILRETMINDVSIYDPLKAHETHMEGAEHIAMQMLIDGKFYAHTGVYDLFDYGKETDRQVLPFIIQGQADKTKMCYQMTEAMDLIFDFPKVKSNKLNLIWRYSLEHVKDDGSFETVHGYFKMGKEMKEDNVNDTPVSCPTRLNLSESYDMPNIRWIQFAAFKEDNPQRRAWFNAITGPSFHNLKVATLPGAKVAPPTPPNKTSGVTVLEKLPTRRHRVALTKSNNIRVGSKGTKIVEVYEEGDFIPVPVDSNELEFLFETPCSLEMEKNFFVYDMQVCALQMDMNEKTKETARDPATGNFKNPERFLTNVHGYFKLNSNFATKLRLSFSWDPSTVLDRTVNFYCIDTELGQPTNKFPKVTSKMAEGYEL